jgi:hypothetical protein
LQSLLREVFGEDRFGLQFAPTVIGLAWLAYVGWRDRGRPWDWSDRMPMLVFVSFLTASYGAWPFDLVILLPAVVRVGAELAPSHDRPRIMTAVVAYAAINAAALAMNLLKQTSETFVWMAPTLLVAYVLLRPRRPTP